MNLINRLNCGLRVWLVVGIFVIIPTVSFSQTCDGADGLFPPLSGNTVVANGDICANTAVVPYRWEITYTNVDDDGNIGTNTPANVEFFIDWDDGTTQTVQAGVGDNFIQVTGPNAYRAVVTHLFPVGGGNVQCEYVPEVSLQILGAICPSTTQNPAPVVRWNTDDENTGNMELSENATNNVVFEVCAGETQTVFFVDRSEFNCVPANFLGFPPNIRDRWFQFVYGGDPINNTITGSGITINTNTGSNPQGLGVLNVPTGTAFTSDIALQTQPVTAPTEFSFDITVPPDALPGQEFAITLNNWNACNPYEIGAVPTGNLPSQFTALIRIITSPPAPNYVPVDFCINTPVNLTVTPNSGGVITWYSDAGLTNVIHTGAAMDAVNDPPVANRTDNTVAGVTTYFATETLGNNCEGPAQTVSFEIFDEPSPADAIPSFTVCTTTSTLGAVAPVIGTGAWSVVSGPGTVDVPTDPNSTVSNLNSATPTVFRWTTTNGPCTDTDDLTISRDPDPDTANAGPDQFECNIAGAILAGNVPTVGSGTWTQVGGPGGVTIVAPNNANTTVTGLIGGNIYTFRWTITNGICASSQDDVSVTTDLDPPANAGPDFSVCPPATTAVLAGSSPLPGTGTWTVDSGPGSVTNINDENSMITNLTAQTDLTWTVVSGVCTDDDQVTITLDTPPSAAVAGGAGVSCDNTYTMTATPPVEGVGTWTVISGSGTFADENLATTLVTGLSPGLNQFQWTVANSCGSNSDVVNINNNAPTTSAAGPDIVFCGTSIAMAANTPAQGTGVWSIEAGAGGSFGAPNNPTATFSGVAGTVYTLRWTISNAPCADSFDELTVQFDDNPTVAAAGPNQVFCGNSTTLAANAATVGNGSWSVITGDGAESFGNILSPTSSFSGTAGFTYVLEWGITNGVCPASTSQVTIQFDQNPDVADAGSNQVICNTNTVLDGNNPTVGTGLWTEVSGDGLGTFGNDGLFNSTFSGTAGVTYVLRWTLSNGICADTQSDVTIQIDQDPSDPLAGGDQIVCGTTTNLAGNALAIGTGTWVVTAGDGLGIVATANDPLSQFDGTAGQSYTLEWRASNGVCPNKADDVTITFEAVPSVSDPGLDQVICGGTTNLAATFPAVGTGLWTLISNPDGLGTIVSPSTTTSQFNGTPGVIYGLRWTVSNGSCPVSQNDITVQFDEVPTIADAGADKVVCNSNTLLEGNNPAVGTGMWSIVSNPDGLGAITTPTQFDSPFVGTSGITYTLQWTISNGVCPPSTDLVTIEFGPSLPVPVINGNTNGCVGDIMTFTVPGGDPALYTYTWDLTNLPPSTTVLPGSGDPFHFISIQFFDPVVGDVTVDIQDKATLCDGPSETIALTIDQVPDVTLTSTDPDLTVCEDEVVTYTATDLNGVATSFDFIMNGSTVQSGPSNTYTGTVPFVNSMVVIGYAGICDSPPSPPIIHVVNSNPTKHFVLGGGEICMGGAGAVVSMNNSTLGEDYELYRDGLATGEVITSTGGTIDFSPQTQAGTYTVVALNANNCQVVMDGIATIIENPLPNAYNITGGGTICAGDAGLDISLDGSDAGITYELRRNALPTGITVPGNGAAISFGLISDAATYTIVGTNDITSCESTMNGSQDIIVNALPVLNETVNTPTVCSGDAVDILLNSDLGGSTFTWTAVASSAMVTGMFDQIAAQPEGTTIAQTITNTSGLPQTVTYEITPTNTCVGLPETVEILVNPLPTITISNDEVICEGGSTQLTFNSIGALPVDITYNDGTNDILIQNVGNVHTIVVTPAATTTYRVVSVVDGNGCLFAPANEEATITVETVVADFSTSQPQESCSPYAVTFDNNNIVPGYVYEWSWGDGTPDEISDAPQIQHNFINNSTAVSLVYNVTLTVTNNNVTPACVDVATLPITLLPTVNVNLSPDVTEGCGPLDVAITNNSIGASNHQWFYRVQGTSDMNDVRVTPHVVYTLPNTTTTPLVYEIVYEGSNGVCSYTEVTEVTVYPEVQALFDVNGSTTPPTVLLTDAPHANINNLTTSSPTWTYEWNYGDGNTSVGENPISPYTYANFGIYNISLVVTEPDGGCTDVENVQLRVEPTLPDVDFSATPTTGCAPLEVDFINESFSVDPDTYLWEFIDPLGNIISTSSEVNPSFVFNTPGVYSVRLSGSNSLGSVDELLREQYIEVYELPTSVFQIRPQKIFLPDGVLFTFNASRNSVAWEWDFGDGEVSNEFEPEHSYAQTGIYTIEMVALSAEGCSDTSRLENAVEVVDGGTLRIPNAFTPSLSGPTGGVAGSGTFNDVFLPIVEGVETFHMQIYDRWGTPIFESFDKRIGWDGYDKNGVLVPSGVYVYKLNLKFGNNEKFEKIGDVTLIR